VFDFFDRHTKRDFQDRAADYLGQNAETASRSAIFSVGRTLDKRVQIIMQLESGTATLTLGDSDTDLLIRLLTAARSDES
jgi:hypothetical protein